MAVVCFQFYPVCSFGKFISFGPGTVRSEWVNRGFFFTFNQTGATISKEATATISAKPQLRNTQAELTKLVPTALRVKREQPKNKAKLRPSGIASETVDIVSHNVTQTKAAETGTKDDAYALFMKEMQGLL